MKIKNLLPLNHFVTSNIILPVKFKIEFALLNYFDVATPEELERQYDKKPMLINK